jgi:hypothetical protein
MNYMLSQDAIWSFWNMTLLSTTLGANTIQSAHGITKKRTTCFFLPIFSSSYEWILEQCFLRLVIINAYSCPNTWHVFFFFIFESVIIPYKFSHYYKMWVQFISFCSLDQWIHYFFISPHSLQLMNSLKIQWNHLAYMHLLL